MKRALLFCIIGTLFIVGSLYAASGDFIVNGNLGVGLTDPTFGGKVGSRLSVVGGTGLAIGASTTKPAFAINPDIGGSWQMYDYALGSWSLGLVQSGGKVGIGTAPGGYKLDVYGVIHATRVIADNNVIGTMDTSFGGYVGTSLSLVASVGNSGLQIGNSATQPSFAINPVGGIWTMYDYATGGWTAGITQSGGKVGIGTTSPNAKLTVGPPLAGTALGTTFTTNAGALGTTAGNELALANIGFTSGNNTSLGIRAYRAVAGSDWTTSAIGLGMDVDNTVRAGASLWLHANGNVGIGTTTPGAKLQVKGSIALGSTDSRSAGGFNKALCWTTTNTIGYCSSAIGSTGGCTCNAIQ